MRSVGKSISASAVLLVALALSGCAHLPFVGGDEPEPGPAARGSVASGDNGGPEARPGNHPLRPGDRIRVSSWREEGITDEFVVDEDGTAVLPLLGTRTVADRPADELKAALVKDYEAQFRNHTVSVTLLRRVSILGAVTEPGIYHVDPTMTISEAVALAGGPTDDGKMSEVKILRDGEEIEARLSQRAPLRRHVRSGDQIIVPKRNWFARNAALLIGTSVSAVTVILTQGFFR